jgi:hypothetical protein
MVKPNWKPIRIRLGNITAWDENPRMSNKAQAKRIIDSEKKFNQVIPFIVSPSNKLYDGHQRLAAWLTVHGADHVMDAMQADRELTEAEHKELILTLHVGATGSWNWDVLASWQPAELREWGMDAETLKGWNNDANNLKELIISSDETPDFQPVGVDEQGRLDQKKPVTCPECGHEFTPK